jgi:hypothetical protein
MRRHHGERAIEEGDRFVEFLERQVRARDRVRGRRPSRPPCVRALQVIERLVDLAAQRRVQPQVVVELDEPSVALEQRLERLRVVRAARGGLEP